LFDEMLDVLPKAWSGEPFDAAGLHFAARGVIQRPAPTFPIPIWIGGNSKLTRRRVAERAQGWMPMVGAPEEMAKSTRGPSIPGVADFADKIAEVKDLAGDRADEIDFCMSYIGAGIEQPTVDVERHRDTIAALDAIGVQWVAVTAAPDEPAAVLDFVRAFGETYCQG
jgi:alkanesulfonate monooxygenase SsuD/methylene tetrahydromethanopterin reductase-like flavin-dependent oxidoreductase (luciferase family)